MRLGGRRVGDGNGGNTLLTLGQSAASNAGLLVAGQVVAGYRIESRAGAGGMGVVYRAIDVELGRPVALKVIAPDLARDERFRELFKDESRKAAALEHPNVIPIYRSGEEDGLLYIAMRFVDGASLHELIHRRGRLPVGAAVRIVSQVADALDAAHAHGLVHRDVKPGNILVADASGEEHVSLTDFGLSVPIAQTQTPGEGRYAGTPAYLSPEQIRGAAVDARTDVYALGCVLFHALTGRVPFASTGFEAKVIAHLTEPPPSASDLVPGLPTKLDEVVRKAMAKRPEDRFASTGELAAAARAARSDVLICHDARDTDTANTLAERLCGQGLEVRLAGGDVTDELWSARACLLLVGRRDLAEWARQILAGASDIVAMDPRFMLVSVLLPGAPEPFDAGLSFLASRPFVDLRSGIDDPHAVVDLLRAVDAGPVGRARPIADDVCPYRGLEAFQEDDAELFFGRDRETALLAAKLRTSRFLAVLGASGSGKSSLVRAGLIPALRAAGPVAVAVVTPGPAPLTALAAQLERMLGSSAPSADELAEDVKALDASATRVASRSDGAHLVIVVDQFEETFSLASSPREQRGFIDNLVYAATIPGGTTRVVLAMRSDFYHRCAEHPALRALIAEQQFLVGPLDAPRLRQAIEEPARRAGLDLERGLVRRILTDVADQPGALPLMEHLLLELWRRRRARTLTLEAYTASGGVGGALANRADEAYASLDADQQTIARQVLLRLTQPGEGTEDTRRRALLPELVVTEGEEPTVRAVVDHLVAARLVVLTTDDASGATAVEVTHEALIRGWPKLRSWIEGDREALRLHRRLTEAADEWHASGRDESGLYRGARLAAWGERDMSALNERERGFLVESRARLEREQSARRQRTKIVIGALGMAVAAVSAVAAFGFVQRDKASEQRDIALSRQIAGSAREQLDGDPELSLLLGLRAYDIAPTVQSEEIVRQATFESRVRTALRGHKGVVNDVVYSGDGRVIATAGADGTVRIWPASGGVDPIVLSGHDGPVRGVRFVGTADRVVSVGADGSVRLWDVATRTNRILGRHKGPVNRVDASADGRVIATAGDDGTVGIWSPDSARVRMLTGHEGPVVSVAVSADGSRVASGGASDLTVRVWDPANGHATSVLTGYTNTVMGLGLSPDGRRLVSVWNLGALRINDLGPNRDKPIDLPGHQALVRDAEFSPDGSVVASSSRDGTVRLWDARTGKARAVLRGHPDEVYSVAFDPTGAKVASSSIDGVRIWDWKAGSPQSMTVEEPARGGVRYANDSHAIVVGTFYDGVERWDPVSGRKAVIVADDPKRDAKELIVDPTGAITARLGLDGAIHTTTAGKEVDLPGGPAATIAISDDRSILASAGTDGTISVRQATPAAKALAVGHADTPPTAIAVARDGAVATAAADGSVWIWRGAPELHGRLVARHTGQVVTLAFTPDGAILASAGQDRVVRMSVAAGAGAAIELRGHGAVIRRVAFDASGSRLVSVSDDGLRIWDWRRAEQFLRLSGMSAQDGAISPDGVHVAGLDFTTGTLNAWECDVCGPLTDVFKLAQRRVSRRLNADEERLYGLSNTD